MESIKNIFTKQSETDFWTTLSEDEKQDILQGIKDFDKNETVNYLDFITKYRESEK